MSRHLRILLIADLHLCVNLRDEMAAMTAALPAGFYDVVKNGRMCWNNTMLAEDADRVFAQLVALTKKEHFDFCMFLGDMVNTNHLRNVDAFVKRCGHMARPIGYVLGNHDIYLAGDRHNISERMEYCV